MTCNRESSNWIISTNIGKLGKMFFVYFDIILRTGVGYKAQRKFNVYAMQIIIPKLHFVFPSKHLCLVQVVEYAQTRGQSRHNRPIVAEINNA